MRVTGGARPRHHITPAGARSRFTTSIASSPRSGLGAGHADRLAARNVPGTKTGQTGPRSSMPGGAMAGGALGARPRPWPASLAWALWALTLLGPVATVWLDRLLRQVGRA